MQPLIVSPISHQPATLLKKVPVAVLIDGHNEAFGIDVSGYYKDNAEISLYQCNETGYRFFYPFGIEGDDRFYEALQKYNWYYSDWKWDYDAALPFVPNGSKVLDIGCGNGNFLLKLQNERSCICMGLEFNDKAVQTCRSKGLEVFPEMIQAHAETHAAAYDVVCFFQVLEHIADIDSFMKAAIACLKPGGTLIICVPNNNPYYFQYKEFEMLNWPPHHMGWWDAASLKNLSNIYPIRHVAIREERLRRYRFYTQLYIDHKAPKPSLKRSLLQAGKLFMTAYFVLRGNHIPAGHILSVYTRELTNTA